MRLFLLASALLLSLALACCFQNCEPNSASDCFNCPSCVVKTNPTFDRQCAADIVLIFDESGSIASSLDDVKAAARSFFSAFSQVNAIGGTANLGVLEFSQDARLVTVGGNAGVMATLDSAWVSQLNAYIDNNAENQGATGYRPGGCTNWGRALEIAHDTAWRVGSSTGATKRPDVILWFTDGAPTTHGRPGAYNENGRCNRNCNRNSIREDTRAALGSNQGSDRGVACYHADRIKASGTKLFLVGVGGIANNIDRVVLTTGPTAWDQQVDSFATADYVVNADFKALGAIFYNVAKGLCRCLQDQTPCRDTTAQPQCADQLKFDAYVRVSASALSQQWPPNSVVDAYLYYEFDAQPARFAWEIMSASGTELVRTDIVSPCSVSKRVGCPGGSCGTITDQQLIPRFFVSHGETGLVSGPPAPPGTAITCGSLFRRTLANGGRPEEIEYLWIDGTAGGSICAARAVDGTLYEFFTDSTRSTRRANQRGTQPPRFLRVDPNVAFDFNQLNNCATPTCNADVDLVFVVDVRFDLTDWFNVKQYIQTIAGSFSDANNRIRMAAVFADGTRIPATGFETSLVGFGNLVMAKVHNPSPSATWDVVGTLERLIGPVDNAVPPDPALLWPRAKTPVDAPRYILTILGGPDVNNPTTPIATLDSRRAAKSVTMWAIGVAGGSNQVSLLPLISEQPPAAKYVHFDVLGLSNLLAAQVVDQAPRLCPVSDLCNGACPTGLCLCGTCSCPPQCRATTTPCQVSECKTPAIGCVFFDKAATFQPAGCVPTDPDPCMTYGCDKNGNCITGGVAGKCGAACGCTKANVPNCKINDPTQDCTKCSLIDVTCGGDVCASSCNPDTGLCTLPACDDGNACTDDKCVVRQVGGKSVALCQYTDETTKYCNTTTDCAIANCTDIGGGQRQCSENNITSLFDLCGECNGDFASCFFSSVDSTGSTAGIAAGVVAAIVISVIVAAVILALLGRKGAQYWAARSAMAQPNMTNNPGFVDNSLAGENIAYSAM